MSTDHSNHRWYFNKRSSAGLSWFPVPWRECQLSLTIFVDKISSLWYWLVSRTLCLPEFSRTLRCWSNSKHLMTKVSDVILFAEKFGTSFALIKSDIGGNIDRLEEARKKGVQKFEVLFEIALEEISRGRQGDKYSESRALLWLKRWIIEHYDNVTPVPIEPYAHIGLSGASSPAFIDVNNKVSKGVELLWELDKSRMWKEHFFHLLCLGVDRGLMTLAKHTSKTWPQACC